jgi:uncharacterized protein YeaO (DUF488 family)
MSIQTDSSETGDIFPYSIYTIRHSRDLAVDYNHGKQGKFTENKRWTSAVDFLSQARKAGQKLPILFAAGESIDGAIYFAFIDEIVVSPLDENGNGSTAIRFSELKKLHRKLPLSALRLKSSGKPLSEDFIRPYALCHTPDILPANRDNSIKKHESDHLDPSPYETSERKASHPMLKVKSVTEPIHKDDGLRILATRYRGRAMSTECYDVWMACLGPSEELLKSVEDCSWREWSTRYRDQMLGADTNEPKNPVIRNAGQKFTLRLIKHLAKRQNVTLMCHCPEGATECHRFLLRDLIDSSKI